MSSILLTVYSSTSVIMNNFLTCTHVHLIFPSQQYRSGKGVCVRFKDLRINEAFCVLTFVLQKDSTFARFILCVTSKWTLLLLNFVFIYSAPTLKVPLLYTN